MHFSIIDNICLWVYSTVTELLFCRSIHMWIDSTQLNSLVFRSNFTSLSLSLASGPNAKPEEICRRATAGASTFKIIIQKNDSLKCNCLGREGNEGPQDDVSTISRGWGLAHPHHHLTLTMQDLHKLRDYDDYLDLLE